MKKTISTLVIIFLVTLFYSCKDAREEKQNSISSSDNKESLQNAINQFPDSLLLVQDLIELYRNEGSYDSAIALTNAQIKKNGNNAYLWNMKATLHFENDDTLNAIKSLEHAVNIYPLPEYIAALGTVYAEMKNPRSLMIADSLLKMNRTKRGKDAFFIKGLFYSYSNDKNKAVNYFDSSLQLDYTYMFSYREKAIALYDLGNYDEALKVLKRAVTVQNNFDEGYYWMGKCYEKLNRKADAIQSYQTALLYDKNFSEAKEALYKLNSP